MGVDPPTRRARARRRRAPRSAGRRRRGLRPPAVVDYAVRLVLATRAPADQRPRRPRPLIAFGASPRASLGLVAAGRALALLRGRDYVLPAGRVRRRARGPASPARAVLRGAGRRRRRPTTSSNRVHHRDPTAPRSPRARSGFRARGLPGLTGSDLPEPGGRRRRALCMTAPRSAPRVESTLRRLELDVSPTSRRPAAGRPPRSRARPGTEPGEGREYQLGRRRPAHRLERHRPHRRSRTCATPSPTASSRRGSSSTARPASTSAPREFEKRDLALAAVAAVGFLTSRVRQPGRRARSSATTAPSVVPARAGREAMFALLHQIDGVPRPDGAPPAGRRPAQRAAHGGQLARRRGLVVVISDFLTDPEWQPPAAGAGGAPRRARGRDPRPAGDRAPAGRAR